jgi:hypothetical protein
MIFILIKFFTTDLGLNNYIIIFGILGNGGKKKDNYENMD